MQPEQSLFQDIYLVSEFFASAQQSLELLHFLIDHPGLIGLRVHVFLEVAWCQWRVILKLFPHEKVVVSIDPRPDLQNCLLEPLSILVIAAFAQKLQSCTKQPLMSSLCFSHQLGHLFSETNIFQSLGTAAFFPTCGPCASPLSMQSCFDPNDQAMDWKAFVKVWYWSFEISTWPADSFWVLKFAFSVPALVFLKAQYGTPSKSYSWMLPSAIALLRAISLPWKTCQSMTALGQPLLSSFPYFLL